MVDIPLTSFQKMSEEILVKKQSDSTDLSLVKERKKGCATGKFPKSARILSRTHYKQFVKGASRLFGQQISIDIRQGKPPSAKLGITVSRKFGKAHDRNRFKRVVREAFREIYLSLPSDLELNILPRKRDICLTKQAILLELQQLLSKKLL